MVYLLDESNENVLCISNELIDEATVLLSTGLYIEICKETVQSLVLYANYEPLFIDTIKNEVKNTKI